MMKPNLVSKILLLVLAILFSVFAHGQVDGDYQSRVNAGNWNASTSWQVRSGGTWVNCAAGDYPGASAGAGTVYILDNHQITITANVPNSIGALRIDGGANSSYLIFNSGISLSVIGETYLNSNSNMAEKAVLVDAGIFNTGSVNANSSGPQANRDAYIRISTGTVTVDNNIVLNSNNRQTYIRFTGSGLLYVGGTITGGTITSKDGGGNSAPTSGTVIYNGSSEQSIGSYTYFNLATDNSAGFTLGGDVNIDNLLTFVNGIISTGTNNLILSSGGSVSGSGAGKYVNGNFEKGIPIGALSITFEIGDASVYAPILIDFSGTTNGTGTITASTTSGDHPQISSSGFDSAFTVNRYWTLTNNGVTGFSSYDATFNFVTGDADSGTNSNDFVVANYDAATWTYPTTGTLSTTSTQATGLTNFGDFQVGQTGLYNYRTTITGNWNQASTWQVQISGVWTAASLTPNVLSDTIIIRNGHIVTNTAITTVDQVRVLAGGSLILNSELVVANGAGTDLRIDGSLECSGSNIVSGAGSFLLTTGATLLIGSPDGITTSGASGSIQTATRSFDQGANYSYNGSSVQSTGNALPSIINNLTIDNSSGVTLSGSVAINGTLDLLSGELTTGATTLTFQTSDTPISVTSGSISTSISTNLVFGTPGNTGGAAFTIPSGVFNTDPTINNLTINRTNSLTLNNQMISVYGIILCNGPLNSANNLTLLSDASSTALIDGSGTGNIAGNVTMQRYLNSGFGYKYFSSPFQDATVGEFGDDMDLASSFPLFYRYDESRTSSGWVGYTTLTDPLNTLEGYAVNFGSTATPNTVDVTGAVNNGPLSVTLYNNNNTYTKGFNLVGNPYPSSIDWDAAGWTKTEIDDAIYYFRASTTDQYGGTYSSYVNGISSDPGVATNIIPSMQGFFVHVTDGSYPVTGTLGLTNSVRTNDLTHPFLKSKEASSRFLVRLSARYTADPTSEDKMVVYFDNNAKVNFDSDLDALKLMNTDLAVPNLFAVISGGEKLSINALPEGPDTTVYVPLGLRTYLNGEIGFRIMDNENMPEGMEIFLRDAITGANINLLQDNEYKIILPAGDYVDRFYLGFVMNTTDLPDLEEANDFFSVYSSQALINATVVRLDGREGMISVFDLGGRQVFSRKVYDIGYYEMDPGLKSGIYIIRFYSGKLITVKKIFIGIR